MWYHSHSPKTKRPIRRVRPALQTLEDRMTPALIYVNTLEDVVADDGKRSLREAIDLANRTPTPDTIVLKAGQYQITRPGSDNANQTGDFDVTGHVTIIGQGASKTGINGAQIDRLFDLIGPINVNFANLTLWNGRVLLGNGGCIQALDANIKMANCFVIDNQAVWGGGISTTNGNVTLINSFAARNFAGADGGGIHSDNGTLTLRNSSVHDNQAGDEGGGINAVSGKVTLTGSTLTGNVANQDGGGINLGTGALIMNNCRVLNNRAYGKGGGIGSQSEAILTNSTVGGNYSDGVGGGIHAAAVSLTKSNVRGNAARLMGGGISAGTASLMTSTVRDNVAMGGGGGIYASAEATLARSSVIGNSSLGGGGGIMVWTGPAKLTNSFVRGNSARSSGGGIFATAVDLTGSTVNGNNAETSGGGIFAETAVLVECTIDGNHAGRDGGGIHAQTTIVTASTISGNSSAGDGGGIFAGHAELTGSTVSGNIARGGVMIEFIPPNIVRSTVGNGGGIQVNTATVINCTISGNRANFKGGGIHMVAGVLLNSTIAYNFAMFGSGVAQPDGSTEVISVRNTIIAQNQCSLSLFPDVYGGFTSQGNNLIGIVDVINGFGATGDQTGTPEKPLDPLLGELRNNGGKTQTHALLRGSPAIDHGSNTSVPATDQRGVRRSRDGDGNGSRIADVGAFER